MKPLRKLLWLAIVTALPLSAQAQSSDARRDAEIAQLKQTVNQLMQRIEVLEAERALPAAAPTAATVTSPQAASPGTGATAVVPVASLATLDVESSPLPAHDSFDEDDQSGARVDNEAAPGDALAGFFQIPGSETWLRLSGYAKLDAMVDNDDAGDSDQFITSSFSGRRPARQVAVQHACAADPPGPCKHGARPAPASCASSCRTISSAPAAAMAIACAMPGGSSATPMSASAGRRSWTWTRAPIALDFAGPGAVPVARLASIRQYFPLAHGNQLIVAAEHQSPDIRLAGDDARTRTAAPDLVLAARHEADWGNVELAGLLRYLSYDATGRSDSTMAGGAALTGSWGAQRGDHLVYGVVGGEGIAGYVGDLGGLDLDAVVAPGGDLQTLREWGAWVGYTHLWNGRWRSTLTYGRLYLERDAVLDPTAFRRSDYAAANIVWAPAPSWSWGLELLYGKLQQQDGEDADAMRLQTSLKYDFIR